MPQDTIDELRKALNHIRKENNRMKIHFNQYRTQVKIRESVEGGGGVQARTIHAITSY